MNTLPSFANESVFAHHRSVVFVQAASTDADGTNLLSTEGTGFLIGSHGGRSLVMTVWHNVCNTLASSRKDVVIRVPAGCKVSGRIVFHDQRADLALILVPDNVIPGEALEFSDNAVTDGRDLVMLGYFMNSSNVIIEPGTSHGHVKGTTIINNIHYIDGTYTAKKGTSGAPVFVIENGAAHVVGVMSMGIGFGEARQVTTPRAVAVPTIISFMRNILAGVVGEMTTIDAMIPLLITAAVEGCVDE